MSNISKEQIVVNKYGQKMFIEAEDFIGKKIVKHGIYDGETIDLIQKVVMLSQAHVMLDVGANIGNHSLAFSTFAKKVFSFEPGEKAFNLLSRNIDINQLNNVTVLNFGLSNYDQQTTLYTENAGNLGESSLYKHNLADKKFIENTVRLKRGDAFANEYGLSQLDFIKVDVEGHEREVIDGLSETIKQFRPIVQLEWESDSSNRSWIEGEQNTPSYFLDYYFYALILNTSQDYWTSLPFGKLRRFYKKISESRQRVLYPLSLSQVFSKISDLLLVPKEKVALLSALVYKS
jgi:FkbM family methyltransferase